MRALAAVAASAAALAVAPAALGAAPIAEIRDSEGALLAEARDAPFAYPADGSILRIGGASVTTRGLELRDVSMLGGRVRVDRLRVPAHGLDDAALDGLTVRGRSEAGTANALLSLGGASYVVVLQQAVVPGAGEGLVGLRVYVGEAQGSVPAGAQILVGPARAAVPARRDPSHPWQLLGVAPAPSPEEISNPFAGIADPFAALRSPSSVGVRAVAIAQQFLGVPYVWAGADPLGGFDCSGLTMYVYRQLGIQLGHFTGSQWYAGQRVPLERLAPGDLVFFNMRSYGPGHMGIYMGQGKFIEAPRRGSFVRISSLVDPARGLQYVGAVRPY
jgi:cell wall-associated NlpC family hydrolase